MGVFKLKIMGLTGIRTTTFKDLKNGDVFFFIKDFVNGGLNQDSHVYMRCGHTGTDKSAVNLKTGICYCFDDKEPVELLEATVNLKPIK